MSPAIKGTDPKAWLQELKSNRRLWVGLVAIPVLVYLLWPSAPASRPVRAAARSATPVLDDRQSRELQKLPDLTGLNRAGELPGEARMYRDLFLFEGPPPPPPPPPPPAPPPPPPTPEQLAAEALRQDKARENASRPQNLRYLGFLGNASAGRLGAFMKGEDPVTIRQGDLANPHWRLTRLTPTAAEFQNVKYAELRHKLDATDAGGAGGRPGFAPANEF
jgi:type IV secretory pathway VirB10-like protein